MLYLYNILLRSLLVYIFLQFNFKCHPVAYKLLIASNKVFIFIMPLYLWPFWRFNGDQNNGHRWCASRGMRDACPYSIFL